MGLWNGIGNGIGRKKRGIDWSSYWATRNAYFALPDTGVSLMVGQEVTIYGDALVSLPIGADLTVTYTCDIGSASGNNYVINPIAANIGDHTLRIVCVSNGVTRVDETIAMTVYEKQALTFGLLRIGDSTIGGEEIATELNAVLDSSTITYLGTQGTTNKHEGYAGYSYAMFARNVSSPEFPSPFFKAGVLDIDAYFTDNSIATPDFINIRLGLNDVFTSSTIGGDGLTDAEMNTIIDDAKTLIDGFLAFDASLKVIVSLPTTTENSGAGWNNNYDESIYSQDIFLSSVHKLQKGLADTFANGTYDTRVDCSYEWINLDRDDGYPKTGTTHNNGVHPDASGYVQLADGLALSINRELADINAFSITVKTDNAGSAADTFVMPTTGAGYDCDIYWGDGTVTSHSGTPGNISHQYPEAGTYTIKVLGTFPRIYFNGGGDRLKLLYIDNWGTGQWTSMYAAFYLCSNMEGRYIDTPDLSGLTTLSTMFSGCSKFNSSVAWDTSTVTNMSYMMQACTLFNQPVPWDTAEVLTMTKLFAACTAFNQSVASFNTAKVTDMEGMFNSAGTFNQSVANFNTAAVTTMNKMFYNCGAFKQSLAAFSLDAITNMAQMLEYSNINATGTTTNYDATLVAWATADVPDSITFHGGTSKYSTAGGGTAARAILTDAPNSWSITDGGQL